MIILYIGGQKSGKSRLAEKRTLELSTDQKPVYLATSEVFDVEMKMRIDKHKTQRADHFETIEEPLHLLRILNNTKGTVLVECLSIWINNMLHYEKEAEIFTQIESILKLKQNFVFVLNDVGSGIIPDNALARKYIDISGALSQRIAEMADEVHFVTAGLSLRMK